MKPETIVSELVDRQRKVGRPDNVDLICGRQRRVIFSGMTYELTLRVREGLPFIPNRLVRSLLQSAMSQACFVTGLSVCHYMWMGNHAHIILVSKGPEELTQFYGIIKKSITDFIKRLLGLSRLNLWEHTGVHLLPSAETVIDRIAYLYANPAKANLVERIEDYPGLNSFQSFKASSGEISSDATESVAWIRAKYLEKLDDLTLTEEAESKILSKIFRKVYYRNKLRIEPNIWMRCFEASPQQAAEWHIKTLGVLTGKEDEARKSRLKEEKPIMGSKKLKAQAIMSPFIPRKYQRGVFVICLDKDKRLRIISLVKGVRKLAHDLYQEKFKYGQDVRWPAGIFPPRPQLQACAIGF